MPIHGKVLCITNYETEDDGRDEAAGHLARIRVLMERSGQFSHLSGYAAMGAGLCAIAGAVLSWRFRINFNHPSQACPLAAIWGAVFFLAVLQAVAFTVAQARRRGEPAWSPISQQVVIAMLPAVFMGAIFTGYALQSGELEILPSVWMMAYGSSLMGLGLYAGGRIKAAAMAFLALGALSLFLWRDYGLRMMLVSFGAIHLVLGVSIAWKPQK